MNRRCFLSGAVTGITGWAAALRRLASPAAASSPTTTPRLSMSEYWPYVRQSTKKIQTRFDLYRQIGFGTLRTDIEWRVLEDSEGNWRVPPFLRNYLKQAVDNGFRLKLRAGTVGAPPRHYLDAHRDARIQNASGNHSRNFLSLWYPGLQALLTEKTDRLFECLAQLGIFDATDFIFIDLGPAGEPIYPAPWTMGETQTHGPWFYDDHARAAFASAMRKRYPSLREANRVWRTPFASWETVTLPRPREHPGTLWEDALLWYRDSKRDFIRWQVANYRRALTEYASSSADTRLIIMVPGTHIRPLQWQQAFQTGRPGATVTVMTDSEFLLELANETGCWLQHTSVGNGPEVRYLYQYMKTHNLGNPMWGENAGSKRVARDPGHLADVILANNLYGLDYVNSRYIFASDGTVPNETFRALSVACLRLRRELKKR